MGSLFCGGLARRFWRGGCVALVACLAVGGTLAKDSGPAGAREYSAYADPEKPVISYLFSQRENVEAFKSEFGLDDGEVERALAATREEKVRLETEYAESERIVEANGDLPPEVVGRRVSATDYDEKVRSAVAGTKSEIESLLPEDRRNEFGPWVDARWEREQEEYYAESGREARRSRPFRCWTIHASWYKSNTENGYNLEVALPHKKIKFAGGRKVRVMHDGRAARLPVKEVGPWNIRDNYWAKRKSRDMWRDLPRCKPEAEAAFFGNYNRGEDQYGREVANPAGIDLTLKAAEKMGVRRKLKRQGIIKVNVGYLWMRR